MDQFGPDVPEDDEADDFLATPRVSHKGRGRIDLPTEFTIENFETLCRLQCTQEELAAVLGVSLATLKNRLKDDPEIAAAYDRGRHTGRISLRRRQVQIARIDGPAGAMMSKWLGQNWLNQRDKVEHTGEGGGPLNFVISKQDAGY